MSHMTLLPSRKPETVVLFGEVLADMFVDRKVLGGAPFNVARHLQAFGLRPVLITRTGNDDLRQELLEAMSEAGMSDQGIQLDVSHPTGQVLVHMDGSRHRFEILPGQAYDYIHAGLTHLIAMAVRPELIYFGTLAQRSARSAQALTALIHSSRAPRLLDINLREPWYDKPIIERSLKRANVAKLNQEELSVLAAMFRVHGKSDLQKAGDLVKRFALDSILVTCGNDGAWLLGNDGKEIQIKGSTAPSLVDTVGAGDGFAAVYILGLLRNWPAKSILQRANAFAAALCGLRGAVPDNPSFYKPFLKDWRL